MTCATLICSRWIASAGQVASTHSTSAADVVIP